MLADIILRNTYRGAWLVSFTTSDAWEWAERALGIVYRGEPLELTRAVAADVHHLGGKAGFTIELGSARTLASKSTPAILQGIDDAGLTLDYTNMRG